MFICVFAVALFFVTILFMTNKLRKPGDRAQPVGYKRQDDERQKGDQASCRWWVSVCIIGASASTRAKITRLLVSTSSVLTSLNRRHGLS
jgi:hypothetical protein